MAKLLVLYRNPKTFVQKFLVYESEQELFRDRELGLVICGSRVQTGRVEAPLAKALHMLARSLAQVAGVIPGDFLQAVSGTSQLNQRQPPPLAKEILYILCAGNTTNFGFPVSLEFRGSTSQEIIERD